MNKFRTFTFLFLTFCVIRPAFATQPIEDQLRSLGVGVWIWNIKGSPERYLAKAKRNGLGHVYLKAHDGKQGFQDVDKVPKIAKMFHANGIKVFIWGYNFANDPQREASIIEEWLSKDYVDGYIYNSEAGLKGDKMKWGKVETMLQDVWDYRAQNYPNKLLGFAPYAFPSLHPTLPYPLLVRYSDFIEPQMYHKDMRISVKSVVNKTYREWLAWQASNGTAKPIIPIGQSYDGVSSEDIVEFGKRTRGYYAVAYYVWQGANTDNSWEGIHQVAVGRSTKWGDVGQDNQPLSNQSWLPASWYQFWLTCLRVRWFWAYVLLAMLFISTTYTDWLTQKQVRFWLIPTLFAIWYWPYVLVGSVTLLILAGIIVGLVRILPKLRSIFRR